MFRHGEVIMKDEDWEEPNQALSYQGSHADFMLPDEETYTELVDNQKLVMGARTDFKAPNKHWQRLWQVNMGYDIIAIRNGKPIYRSSNDHKRQKRIIQAMDYADTIADRLGLPIPVKKLYKSLFVSLYKHGFVFRYNRASMDDWAGVMVVLASQVWSPYSYRNLQDLYQLGDVFHWRLLGRMLKAVTSFLDDRFRTVDFPAVTDKHRKVWEENQYWAGDR
jgi:hypothetical protein